jgi:hypothetical protein
MAEVWPALAISGGILLGVVVFIVIVSIAAVNRGEAAMHEDAKHGVKPH